MSIDQKKLRADFELYLRGEDPSPARLATAPLIEGWSPTVTRSPDGRQMHMTLTGIVTGHPLLMDGRRMETSPVVWIDRRRRWARTMSRVYALGKPAADGGARAEEA